jgi:hypothetical protein
VESIRARCNLLENPPRGAAANFSAISVVRGAKVFRSCAPSYCNSKAHDLSLNVVLEERQV